MNTNWIISPHRMTCLICFVLFAIGAGWLAGIGVAVDYIKTGNLGLGVIGIIVALYALVAGLLVARRAGSIICSVCTIYSKPNAANNGNNTSWKQNNAANYQEDCASNCEDSPQKNKRYPNPNRFHLARVYRLLKAVSTKNERNQASGDSLVAECAERV